METLTKEQKQAVKHVTKALDVLGFEFNQSTIKTPERWVKAITEFGIGQKTGAEFDFTKFPGPARNQDTGMIVVSGIEFSGICEHHLFPFFGYAHVGYIRNDSIAGLSKLPRSVRLCLHQAGVQEHMAASLADYLQENLRPFWLGVVVQATHTCMTCRGAEANNAMTTNSVYRGGYFKERHLYIQEFLTYLQNRLQ